MYLRAARDGRGTRRRPRCRRVGDGHVGSHRSLNERAGRRRTAAPETATGRCERRRHASREKLCRGTRRRPGCRRVGDGYVGSHRTSEKSCFATVSAGSAVGERDRSEVRYRMRRSRSGVRRRPRCRRVGTATRGDERKVTVVLARGEGRSRHSEASEMPKGRRRARRQSSQFKRKGGSEAYGGARDGDG